VPGAGALPRLSERYKQTCGTPYLGDEAFRSLLKKYSSFGAGFLVLRGGVGLAGCFRVNFPFVFSLGLGLFRWLLFQGNTL